MLEQSNTLNFPKKGLLITHLNIYSLWNHELCCLGLSNYINILAISETHLNASFEDAEISIHEYHTFRKDGNIIWWWSYSSRPESYSTQTDFKKRILKLDLQPEIEKSNTVKLLGGMCFVAALTGK